MNVTSRAVLIGVASVILWILWCVLVVKLLVPAVRLHLTMWPWLLSYLFCLGPVLILATVFVLRTRSRV